MFTGIIESKGKVVAIEKNGTNYTFTIESEIAQELQIDQSVSHNGVCLTVVAIEEHAYNVTVIEETIKRSNLGQLKIGDALNLERAMKANNRLDGHLVQGHVDTTCICKEVEERGGSWYFTFEYEKAHHHLLVDKGSVCINGVSLTVINPKQGQFQVAIIPYTFEHTNFNTLKKGDSVNIEFDILGKYIARYMEKIRDAH
jgi:riboflavin synthase